MISSKTAGNDIDIIILDVYSETSSQVMCVKFLCVLNVLGSAIKELHGC